MSPGVYVAIGIGAGTVIGVAVGNGFLGVAIGLAGGIAWYIAVRLLASRRRP